MALARPAELSQKRGLVACLIGAILLIGLAAGAVPTGWLLQVPLIRNVGHLADTVMTALMVPTLILTAAGLRAATMARPAVLARFCLLLAAGGTALWMTNGGVAALHQFDQWLLLFVLGLSSVAPLVVSTAGRYPSRMMPVLCSGTLILGVSGLGGLHLPTGVPALDKLLPQPRLRVSLDTNSPAVDAARRRHRDPVRTVGEGNLLFQGTEALYELEGIGGPDALSVGPYEELLDAGGMTREWGWRTQVPTDPEQIGPLLDMLNVGLIVRRQSQEPGRVASADADGDEWIDVAARRSAWPRAYFVDGVSRYDNPVQLIDLVRHSEGPVAAIAAADPNASRMTSHLPDSRTVSVPASGYVFTTNRTRFEVEATGPGIAVLTETYVPDDFRAMVNGQRADYFRVNHAFKGVAIPAAGTWDIVFEYRPAHWGIAWVAAMCGAIMLLALAIASVGRAPEGRPLPTICTQAQPLEPGESPPLEAAHPREDGVGLR